MSPPMRAFYKLEKRYARGEVRMLLVLSCYCADSAGWLTTSLVAPQVVDLSSALTRQMEPSDNGYDGISADSGMENNAQLDVASGISGGTHTVRPMSAVSAEDLAFWGSDDEAAAQNAMLAAEKPPRKLRSDAPPKGNVRLILGRRQRTSNSTADSAGQDSSRSRRSLRSMRPVSGRGSGSGRKPPTLR